MSGMDKRSTAGKKRQKSITDLFKKPAKNAKSRGDSSVGSTSSAVPDSSVVATSSAVPDSSVCC